MAVDEQTADDGKGGLRGLRIALTIQARALRPDHTTGEDRRGSHAGSER
jgi:hypothetical protein